MTTKQTADQATGAETRLMRTLAELRQPRARRPRRSATLRTLSLILLPATLGTKGVKDSEPDSRIALDHAFAAGFEQIYQSPSSTAPTWANTR